MPEVLRTKAVAMLSAAAHSACPVGGTALIVATVLIGALVPRESPFRTLAGHLVGSAAKVCVRPGLPMGLVPAPGGCVT